MFQLDATIGDLYRPAMKITDPDEAKRYFADLVEHVKTTTGKPEQEAIDIVRHNLGYFAGYYGTETRRQIEQVFDCAHPLFGPL